MAFYSAFFNTYDVERYVRSCAGKVGMSVRFEDGANPHTKGKQIILPKPSSSWTQDDLDNMKYFVKHETSHVQYTPADVFDKRAGKEGGLLESVLNILEDYRVDRLNDTEFRGDAQLSASYTDRVIDKLLPKANEDVRTYLAPIHALRLNAAADYMSNGASAADSFTKALTKQGAEYDAKIKSGDYMEVLKNIADMADDREAMDALGDLADRIIKEVFDQDPEDYKQPEPEKQAGEGGKGEADGEGEEPAGGSSDGSGEDESEGEGEEADGAGKTGKGKDGKAKMGEEKILNLADTCGSSCPPSRGSASKTGLNHNTLIPDGKMGYKPNSLQETNVLDMSRPGKQNILKEPSHYTADINTTLSCVANFGNLVRMKLQIRSRDRYEGGKRSGRLNKPVLYRVTIPDGGRASEAVFKKQIHNNTLDTCVQILVDCSGSMSGTKFTCAAAAATLLSDSIGNTLHMPVEVLGFTEWSEYGRGGDNEKNTMFIMRQFDQRVVPNDLMIEGFDRIGNRLANNVDGEALMFGYDRIVKRREKRKIMIVLSDGSPAGGHEKGSIGQFTKDVVKKIQEDRRVEIVGIGIQYDVSRLYKDAMMIKNPSELASVLLQTIDRKVI